MSKVIKISRRHVLKAGAAIGVGCCMSVAGVANAQRRGAEPTGQEGEILDLERGTAYDLSGLNAGEMIALKDSNNYIGIIRRDDAQINAAKNSNVSLDMTPDGIITEDERFLVVNLRCEHRGCQVGYTGEAGKMFECPCHKTSFDAAGRVLPEKAKTDKNLAPVAHSVSGDTVTFS